jgi:hypothetical protein
MREEGNVKALYRSAKACLAIDKVDEADDAITRAMNLDPSNWTFNNLKLEIVKRKEVIDARNQQIKAAEAKKREADRTLQTSLKVLS